MTTSQQSPTSTPKPMTEFDATEPHSFERRERNALEHQTHKQVNIERRERHLPTLDFNRDLTYIARTKSRDMAVKGYFAHTEPDGDSHTDRLEDYGYEWETAAENLVRVHVTPDRPISFIADRMVHSWMASPPHRQEILHRNYNIEGVGVYVTSDYTIYGTQIIHE